MTAVPRFSRRSVLDGDSVILARPTDHCASELLGIVAVNWVHFSPAGPFGLHTDAGKPILLWQYRMRNCETGREGAWLLQIDRETKHHATVYVDHNCQRRSLDRLPVLLIDHDDVHGRMVNLGDG